MPEEPDERERGAGDAIGRQHARDSSVRGTDRREFLKTMVAPLQAHTAAKVAASA